jgi:hypothetical protein
LDYSIEERELRSFRASRRAFRGVLPEKGFTTVGGYVTVTSSVDVDDMIEACERQMDHGVLEWKSTVNDRGCMMRPMSLWMDQLRKPEKGEDGTDVIPGTRPYVKHTQIAPV